MGVTRESELSLSLGSHARPPLPARAPDGLKRGSEAFLQGSFSVGLSVQGRREQGLTSFGSKKRKNIHAGEIWSSSRFQDTVGLGDFPGRELDRCQVDGASLCCQLSSKALPVINPEESPQHSSCPKPETRVILDSSTSPHAFRYQVVLRSLLGFY